MTPITHERRGVLEQAIALDPNYALAYVMLAESYFWSAFWGFRDPKEALPKAKAAAIEALRPDDTLAEAHALLGTVRGAATSIGRARSRNSGAPWS